MTDEPGDRRSAPRRSTWFVLGMLAGILVFPQLAGVSMEASWQSTKRRLAAGGEKVWTTTQPSLMRGIERVREMAKGLKRDIWDGAESGETSQEDERDANYELNDFDTKGAQSYDSNTSER